jgi:hypothetical protein
VFNQIFLTLILVLGGTSYWLFNENQTLKENNVKLESAIEEQAAAFNAMKESYEKQGQALNDLSRRTAEIEAEKDRYLDIFRRHNLDKLALMKPGLIETRVNNETKAVFEEIENDSKAISELSGTPSN